ncbi:MAG: NAD-dependent epimerase/dehydratase family protein [Planctomycetota bacterium]
MTRAVGLNAHGQGSPARALVTGGAGFIGSHLVESLLGRGCEVVVLDDLSTGSRGNLPAHGALTVVETTLRGAIGDDGVLRDERVRGPFDHVYHLAAAVGVKRVVDHPIESIETNAFDTAAILRFALRAGRGGSPARTLIASSSEVYGKSNEEVFREGGDSLLGPTTSRRWSYAMSKALGEHLALAHHERHALPVVIARFFNTVGPRQVGEYGMVLPRFVRAALEGEPLVVFGDGEQSRCFCDVRDVAPALPALLACDQALGSVVNIGSDVPISIRTLAETVVKTLGSSSEIEHRSYDAVYGVGFEDLRRRKPEVSRVRGLIGFEPSVALERTIEDLASWMRSERAAVSKRGASAR